MDQDAEADIRTRLFQWPELVELLGQPTREVRSREPSAKQPVQVWDCMGFEAYIAEAQSLLSEGDVPVMAAITQVRQACQCWAVIARDDLWHIAKPCLRHRTLRAPT